MEKKKMALLGCGIAAAMAVGSIGCATTPPVNDLSGLRALGTPEQNAYIAARQLEASARVRGLQGEALNSQLRLAMESIDLAISVNGSVPVLLTKRGDLAEALGDSVKAMEAYTDAIELYSAFSPAWLGLARQAARGGDREAADAQFRRAAASVEQFELDTGLSEDGPVDRSIVTGEKERVVLSQLSMYEWWPGLSRTPRIDFAEPELGSSVTDRDRVRRFRARVAYEYGAFRAETAQSRDEIEDAFDEALSLNPNLYAAHYSIAENLVRIGDREAARARLGFALANLPPSQRDAEPVLMYVDLLINHCRATRTLDAMGQVRDYLDALETSDPDHPQAAILRVDAIESIAELTPKDRLPGVLQPSLGLFDTARRLNPHRADELARRKAAALDMLK